MSDSTEDEDSPPHEDKGRLLWIGLLFPPILATLPLSPEAAGFDPEKKLQHMKCQFSCGISKRAGPKKQTFCQKINILKGNHCILWIREMPVCQKLGIILENKVVQKFSLEKKL